MKNAIIAILVTLAVIGSAVAAPVVAVVGVVSAVKNVTGFIDNSVKISERKDSDYTADIHNAPKADKEYITDEEYQENEKTTDFSKGYTGSTPIYKESAKDENILNLLCFVYDPLRMIDIKAETDISLLVTIDLSKGGIDVISISNDLFVPIENHGWNRLGAAFEYGGIGLYINTVNEVFDLDIQYYGLVDLSHLDELIDWAGGTDLNLNQSVVDFYKDKYDYKVGINHLNGRQIIDLLHDRDKISMSDEVIKDTGKTISGILENITKNGDVGKILKAASNLFKTNLDLASIIKITSKLSSKIGDWSNIKVKNITDNIKKAIVTIEETGEKASVIIMDSIEQVRKDLKNKIYS